MLRLVLSDQTIATGAMISVHEQATRTCLQLACTGVQGRMAAARLTRSVSKFNGIPLYSFNGIPSVSKFKQV